MNWPQIEAALRRLGAHPDNAIPNRFAARILRAAAATLHGDPAGRRPVPTEAEIDPSVAISRGADVGARVLGGR